MRRNIAMALLAVAIATGCAHVEPPCLGDAEYEAQEADAIVEQAEWEHSNGGFEPTMGTHGAMCRWHSPETHELANRKGFILECEGGE